MFVKRRVREHTVDDWLYARAGEDSDGVCIGAGNCECGLAALRERSC